MHMRQIGVCDVNAEMKLLVTVDEAAAMLSLGRSLAWKLVRTNQIQSIKVGTTRRVVVASLHAYVGRQLAQAS